MARGDYASACPLLERSEVLDPGIGTEFNLARCYELSGRLASAWAAYQRVVAVTHAAGESPREEVARGLMLALEPRLARVVLRVRRERLEPGLELRIDGVAVDRARWSIPIPIDPGSHLVEATAPAFEPFGAHVTVEREAQTIDVDVPSLLRQAQPAPASASPGSAQRIAGVVVGGLGLVGVGLGTFFGLRATSLASQASPLCNASGCDPQGYAFRTDSRWAGDACTVSFVVGGALVATAIVLVLTAPHSSGGAPHFASFQTAEYGGGSTALAWRASWP
jgi:hypothetical protein